MEVFLISGMDFMNKVEFFGIYIWLTSIISENKKLDKFFEAKKTETPKIYSSYPTTTQFCYLKYHCIIYLIINPNYYVYKTSHRQIA